MLKTFSLIRAGVHLGPHVWDDEAGVVVSGIDAALLNRMGAEPYSHPSGVGVGTGDTIALRSNDGFIAMLMTLGYETPPELTVENPADTDGDPPGSIY